MTFDPNYPKWLHSPKDNGDTVLVHNPEEQAQKMKEGWLIAPPSQTRGQEAYAAAQKALAEAAAKAAEPVTDEEADVHQPPPKKRKAKAE